ncbi:MAG: hypothetical protein DME94_06065 [Verrucomicrobia bacterium]|nr:MAG: hypothetical protein DME94_06065 [Verrucomicrobiota bacterium]
MTPVHFYQPIPDTQTLPESVWNQPSELVGIDMNDSLQLNLLRNDFPKFRHEYERFPTEPTSGASRFHLNNGFFDGTDALVAYCMVRRFRPRLIIEIGSGYSSLLMGEAGARNDACPLICVEPFPSDFLSKGFPGLKSLVIKEVQQIDLDFFSQLQSGDVLFIDSSHTFLLSTPANGCGMTFAFGLSNICSRRF